MQSQQEKAGEEILEHATLMGKPGFEQQGTLSKDARRTGFE
jgi:hypothetical protein